MNCIRSAQDSDLIFQEANRLNMTGEGHVWLVTEQALYVDNVPIGAIALQQIHAGNEAAHIRDSVYVCVSFNWVL